MVVSNKARKVVLSVEYADEVNSEFNAGISLFAKMIIGRKESMRENAQRVKETKDLRQPFDDDNLLADFLGCDAYDMVIPDDIPEGSLIICDMCDTEYWVGKMMEGDNG